MATGIFSTTRVAGEGLALAGSRAVLATLVRSKLSHLNTPPPELEQAAERVAAGDLTHANVDKTLVVFCYGEAFRELSSILAVVTLAAAIAVLVFLGRRAEQVE